MADMDAAGVDAPAPAATNDPARASLTGDLPRVLAITLLICVVALAALAALTAFHAPMEWNVYNSIVDKLNYIATFILGVVAGQIVPPKSA